MELIYIMCIPLWNIASVKQLNMVLHSCPRGGTCKKKLLSIEAVPVL